MFDLGFVSIALIVGHIVIFFAVRHDDGLCLLPSSLRDEWSRGLKAKYYDVPQE